jgi:hypothetical protein
LPTWQNANVEKEKDWENRLFISAEAPDIKKIKKKKTSHTVFSYSRRNQPT